MPGPGDHNGSGMGRFHFYPMKNKICYRVTVSGIQTATKAHLHMGDEEGGMVKLNLLPPRNSARECARGLGERFIKRIARNSSSYYVDVYNNEYPDGAVRGQLHN